MPASSCSRAAERWNGYSERKRRAQRAEARADRKQIPILGQRPKLQPIGSGQKGKGEQAHTTADIEFPRDLIETGAVPQQEAGELPHAQQALAGTLASRVANVGFGPGHGSP